jgi:hypothetical protein
MPTLVFDFQDFLASILLAEQEVQDPMYRQEILQKLLIFEVYHYQQEKMEKYLLILLFHKIDYLIHLNKYPHLVVNKSKKDHLKKNRK